MPNSCMNNTFLLSYIQIVVLEAGSGLDLTKATSNSVKSPLVGAESDMIILSDPCENAFIL